MTKLVYLKDESIYKDDTYRAFKAQFASRLEFNIYYSKLKNDETKNNFLRVGSTYLFFVKNGDWKVNVPRSNSLIDYFTNSFKLVALLAIVESLSNEKFEDFFQWIIKDKSNFPISNKQELDKLYKEYKSDFGSIRKCKAFFILLPKPFKRSSVKVLA